MYRDIPDREFLHLIFTSGDRLGMNYVEETKVRRQGAVPFLCNVLKNENNYRFEDERLRGVIHAVHLLGIIGDPAAFDAFISANQYSHKYNADWIWDALPECYLRLGNSAISKLMSHIQMFKYESDLVSEQISGLWNIWEAHSEERQKIESFLLQVLKDPGTDRVTRANLIADFAQLGRKDLKPLFKRFYGKGGTDTLTGEDLDWFFESVHAPPTYHYDLEGFYSDEEIEARQECREEESEEPVEPMGDFILENLSSISRNDPCPCGSGKAFKKCHLPGTA
jgi:hypothetical protein